METLFFYEKNNQQNSPLTIYPTQLVLPKATIKPTPTTPNTELIVDCKSKDLAKELVRDSTEIVDKNNAIEISKTEHALTELT